MDLKRVEYGGVSLNNLPTGKTRFLTKEEYKNLRIFLNEVVGREALYTMEIRAIIIRIEAIIYCLINISSLVDNFIKRKHSFPYMAIFPHFIYWIV